MATLTPAEMDKAAELFEKELQSLPQTITIPIARLFKAHFMKCGHKRMGRILVAHAKATDKMKEKDFTTPEDMLILNEPVEKLDVKKFAKKNLKPVPGHKEKEKTVTQTEKKADKPIPKKQKKVVKKGRK